MLVKDKIWISGFCKLAYHEYREALSFAYKGAHKNLRYHEYSKPLVAYNKVSLD